MRTFIFAAVAVLGASLVLAEAVPADFADHPENVWVKQSPRADAPSPKFGWEGSGAYDPYIGKWIHWGGHDGIPQGFHLFLWDPHTAAWEQRFPNTSPPGVCCVDGAETFDLANRRFVRFPGASLNHGWQWSRKVRLKNSAVWLYDPAANTWTNMRPPPYQEPEKYSKEVLGSLNACGTYDDRAPGGPVLRRPGRRRRDEQPVRLRRLRQSPGASGDREPAFTSRRQRFLLRLRQRLRRGVRQPVSDRREDVHLPLRDQQVGSPRPEALPHGQERRPLLHDSQDGLRLHERGLPVPDLAGRKGRPRDLGVRRRQADLDEAQSACSAGAEQESRPEPGLRPQPESLLPGDLERRRRAAGLDVPLQEIVRRADRRAAGRRVLHHG